MSEQLNNWLDRFIQTTDSFIVKLLHLLAGANGAMLTLTLGIFKRSDDSGE